MSRKTFGPKRKEVTEEWEKIANEELHGLYSLKITDNEMGGNVAHMDEKRDTARFLVRNSEERNYLGDLSIYHRIVIAVIDWAGQVNYTVLKAWKAHHFIMHILKKGNSNTKNEPSRY